MDSIARTKQAAGKGRISEQMPEQRVAAAKARPDFAALTARLKSCPDTKQRFSAACKVRGLPDTKWIDLISGFTEHGADRAPFPAFSF